MTDGEDRETDGGDLTAKRDVYEEGRVNGRRGPGKKRTTDGVGWATNGYLTEWTEQVTDN